MADRHDRSKGNDTRSSKKKNESIIKITIVPTSTNIPIVTNNKKKKRCMVVYGMTLKIGDVEYNGDGGNDGAAAVKDFLIDLDKISDDDGYSPSSFICGPASKRDAIIVVNISDDSEAMDAGVIEGDEIIGVFGEPFPNKNALLRTITSSSRPELLIRRWETRHEKSLRLKIGKMKRTADELANKRKRKRRQLPKEQKDASMLDSFDDVPLSKSLQEPLQLQLSMKSSSDIVSNNISKKKETRTTTKAKTMIAIKEQLSPSPSFSSATPIPPCQRHGYDPTIKDTGSTISTTITSQKKQPSDNYEEESFCHFELRDIDKTRGWRQKYCYFENCLITNNDDDDEAVASNNCHRRRFPATPQVLKTMMILLRSEEAQGNICPRFEELYERACLKQRMF